ncbi:hypothetical protein D9756_003049 [Leucocoprinus leucothites]|uniref:F-box domain-containing protein n=1 Tax=Leucocoprinus leucothites TaxID=201217 RepID=A0A8H5G7L2_9AGAR|nr:hypothetical protein D9756_003049 [Leucoagaricus leucothites]
MSSFSPAQRCLSNTELLDLIYAEIWYSIRSSRRDKSRTLVTLAQTCQVWSEVALNYLWRNLRGISPLLRCLPDFWNVVDGIVTIKRPLTDADRTTFGKYARRVQTVFTAPNKETPTAHHALSLVSDGCILPNLRKLEWKVTNPSAFYYIRHYLHPRLEELNVIFNVGQPEQFDVLFTIPAVFSSNLHCLRILDMPVMARALQYSSSRISHALPAWNHLSVLEIPDVTFDGLMSVARMSKLRELKIYQLRSLWVGSDPVVTGPVYSKQQNHHALLALNPPFPVLQNLHLCTHEIAMPAVTDLIRTFQAAELHSLNLRFAGLEDSTSDLADLFRELVDHCNPQALKEFRYSHTHLRETFSSLIQPLFSFSTLKVLWISSVRPFNLSEQEATQIVESLPDIEQFSADNGWQRSGDTPSNTLSVLIPFTACNKLKHLSISLDATDKPRGRVYAGKQTDFPRHEILHFKGSVLEHHQSPTKNFSHAKRWCYIEEILLLMLSRAREREYRRMGVETSIPSEDWTSNWGRRLNAALEEEDGDWSDKEMVDARRKDLQSLRYELGTS